MEKKCQSLEEISYQHVDGVMLGREAYDNPFILTNVDSHIFSENYSVISRGDILKKLLPSVFKYMTKM